MNSGTRIARRQILKGISEAPPAIERGPNF